MEEDAQAPESLVEYEDVGPTYSESYLARIGRFQQCSRTGITKKSTGVLRTEEDIIDECMDQDRSETEAPTRDFVEEDDKESENISVPDRLCQPESPTVVCIPGHLEPGDENHVPEKKDGDEDPTSTRIRRQTSEEKEYTFGSLGPINQMNDPKNASIPNRPRSQVTGWAKLFASTIQRSKSTASQDLGSLSMHKDLKMRPGRKSDQQIPLINSSNNTTNQEQYGIETMTASNSDIRKKKRSIGIDMREKLGFFRKQFGDNTNLPNTSLLPPGTKVSSSSVPSSMARLDHIWQSTEGPPTKDQILSWSRSFEDLLYDKHGILLFLEFLRSEFSDENLEFWSECQNYRSICCPKKLQEKAVQIYEDYVAEQSPKEINIDSVTRIQTSLDIPNATVNTFDQSQKKIQALMEKDSYQRFLRSDIYHGLSLKFDAHPKCLGTLSVQNDVPRVSYIPGLLPNVPSFSKHYQSRTHTNPGILPLSESQVRSADNSRDNGQHKSAPSSPKKEHVSTIL